MPPRNHCRFHPRPPVVWSAAWGRQLVPSNCGLKRSGFGPWRQAPCDLTSGAEAGFSAAASKPPVRKPEPGMANLVYRRRFTVEWGHCDPAGIVFHSRFFEFFDWSVWLLFETALGVRSNELGTTFGIVGIPLVDAKARFLKPAKFNDVADIASEVSEFRRSSFDVAHRISIGGE